MLFFDFFCFFFSSRRRHTRFALVSWLGDVYKRQAEQKRCREDDEYALQHGNEETTERLSDHDGSGGHRQGQHSPRAAEPATLDQSYRCSERVHEHEQHELRRRPEVELAESLERVLPFGPVSYTHLRAHETKANLVCRLLLEK